MNTFSGSVKHRGYHSSFITIFMKSDGFHEILLFSVVPYLCLHGLAVSYVERGGVSA